MNNFENSLLSELRTVVAEREPRGPLASRLRKPGFVALPAGAVGVAAAAAVAITSLGGAGAAYAVTTAPDGDVVVTIKSLSDAAGLQSQLRADGINADVNYDASALPGPGVKAPAPRTPPGIVSGGGVVQSSSHSTGYAYGSGGSTGGHAALAQGVQGVAHSGSGSDSAPPAIAGAPAGTPQPVGVQITHDSTTITIPKADVNSNYTLHITTSGSESGVAGLHFDWWK
jgi:hypothetical protein